MSKSSFVASVAALEAVYGVPGETATVKEVDRITPQYRTFIEQAPFMVLATAGPEELDCSPRGDEYDQAWPARAKQTLW